MSRRWAIRLALSSAPAAGSLRLCRSVEVHETPGALWLRGDHDKEDLEADLKRLPAEKRYTVSAEDRLTPLGARVPRGRLPAGPWQPLSAWLILSPQTAALSGQIERTECLRLVRTDHMSEPNILMTSLDLWVAFATAAPQVRLDPLSFAVAGDGRVVIRGRPLPAAPGARYVEDGGIAVPCGHAVSPNLGSGVLREVFKVKPQDLVIFREGGTYECIREESFVKGGRASVRLSHEELKRHG